MGPACEVAWIFLLFQGMGCEAGGSMELRVPLCGQEVEEWNFRELSGVEGLGVQPCKLFFPCGWLVPCGFKEGFISHWL